MAGLLRGEVKGLAVNTDSASLNVSLNVSLCAMLDSASLKASSLASIEEFTEVKDAIDIVDWFAGLTGGECHGSG